MNENMAWLVVIIYAMIGVSLLAARKPKFSRSIGAGDIPLQWFRLAVGERESMFIKTAYFGNGATFRECGFSVPDSCVEKMVAIVMLATPRTDGSTILLFTQSFATRIYDSMWEEFEAKGGAVKWLDKRSWIATADDDKMTEQVDAFTVPDGSMQIVVDHNKDASNGNRTRYDVTLGFQDPL
tara:strand:+ start:1671 stop:2216 length:546 start_codon:yes stop_codon:yes gene_type:complete